jgi:single-strand DNA-binding protein
LPAAVLKAGLFRPFLFTPQWASTIVSDIHPFLQKASFHSMAKSVNKVILLGNLGKDPEIKFLPSGQAVANFSIATNERFKDKSGEWQDRSEWHNITAYGRTAEIVRDYVKKGNKIFIEGRLTTRSWDDKDTGKKVYRTEIIVNDLTLLSGRGEGDGDRGGNQSEAGYGQRSSTGGYDDNFGDGTGITDDDIPF